ncbi:MAG: hypothetical protein WEB58_17340 [Planctomycetaceae bacterium]
MLVLMRKSLEAIVIRRNGITKCRELSPDQHLLAPEVHYGVRQLNRPNAMVDYTTGGLAESSISPMQAARQNLLS